MVASLAAGCVLAALGTVDIAPGYYTYSSLASQLRAQGYEADVKLAPPRVFALAIHGKSLAELSQSLRSATGDTVTADATTLTVQASSKAELKNQTLASRYLKDYLDQLSGGLRTSVGAFAEIRQAPSRREARQKLQDLMISQPQKADALRLALQLENGEVGRPLPFLAATDFLKAGDRFPPQNVKSGTLDTFADTIFPTGDRVDQRDRARLYMWCKIDPKTPNGPASLGQAVDVAYGFSFDPLSGVLAGEFFLTPNGQVDNVETSSTCLVPTQLKVQCLWTDYLTASDRTDLETRKSETLDMISHWTSADDPMDRQAKRPSVQALKWAIHTNASIVFPVNPLEDAPSSSSAYTAGVWVQSLMHGDRQALLPPWVTPSEGDKSKPVCALTPISTYTASNTNGILAVRDEMEFLNELAEVPETVALRLDSANLDGNATLTDLIGVASDPVWAAYRGGPLPAGLQVFGDFGGALPFLRLANASSSFGRRISSLAPGQNFELPISELKSDAERRLLKDLKVSASSIQPREDRNSQRLFVWLPDGLTRLDGMKIFCERQEAGFQFELRSGSVGADWSAGLSGLGSATPTESGS